MPGSDPAIVTRQLLAVLLEAFEGPLEKGTYFTDNAPDAGFFGTLGKLSPEAASTQIGGSTISAHVFHMVFALEAVGAWIRGDRGGRPWNESWRTRAVNRTEWEQLQTSLRAGYVELCETIAAHGHDDEMAIGGAIGAIAHAAYHLGAIRQKVLLLRT